jgi:hypothetical protein
MKPNQKITLETVQWKVHDWRYSPSLEWRHLKAQWTTIVYQDLVKKFSRLIIDSGLGSSTTSSTSAFTSSNRIDS